MKPFSKRSTKKELLDDEQIPAKVLWKNLRELELINTWLGGHAVTIKGIFSLLNGQPVSIMDIGCGGGDTLKKLAGIGRKKQLSWQLTGVDIKPEAIAFAAENCRDYPEISFICADYRDLPSGVPADLIISSLFCHHLADGELLEFYRWMQQKAKLGFIMNDLHRHAIAYHSIRLITRLFSGSELVKNDAPLSVARGFSRKELEQLMGQAGIARFHLSWEWAFRWLLVVNVVNAKNPIHAAD